jgi:SAM-dependent methyltransferase
MTAHSSERPLPWVRRYTGLIPDHSVVLDLACGNGRHTRHLLQCGHRVVAVDLDVSRLGDLANDARVEVMQADLEHEPWPFDQRRFGGIVVANYLYRPHFPLLIEALDRNGVLLFDTFAAGNERLGRPRNPAFLLRKHELLDAFGIALSMKAYACGEVDKPVRAVRQSLCAVREN